MDKNKVTRLNKADRSVLPALYCLAAASVEVTVTVDYTVTALFRRRMTRSQTGEKANIMGPPRLFDSRQNHFSISFHILSSFVVPALNAVFRNEFHGSAFFKYNEPSLNAYDSWGGPQGELPSRIFSEGDKARQVIRCAERAEYFAAQRSYKEARAE